MIVIKILSIFLFAGLIEGFRAPKRVPIKFGPVLKESNSQIQHIDEGLAKEMELHCKPHRFQGVRKIVLGQQVASENVTDFLWAVAIFRGTDSRQMCTGTLISPIHVLTAGHCLVMDVSRDGSLPPKWTPSDFSIVAGAKCVQDTDQCKDFGAHRIVSKVKNVAITAEMMLGESRRRGGDIVILELETPIKRGDHVEYACLPGKDMDFSLNTPNFIHWGWGKLNRNPYDMTLAAVLNYIKDVSLFDCRESENAVDVDVICTRAKVHDQGTEHGDSGAGLEYIEPITKKRYIVGVLDYSLKDENGIAIRPWETYCTDLRIYAKWICDITGICYQMTNS